MSDLINLPLIAGYTPEGEAMVEQVPAVLVEDSSDQYRVQKSPVFVRGLQADDKIRYPVDDQAGWELLEHRGNLCSRVFTKHNTDDVDAILTPDMELIDGTPDVNSPRALVYSIHVSIGF